MTENSRGTKFSDLMNDPNFVSKEQKERIEQEAKSILERLENRMNEKELTAGTQVFVRFYGIAARGLKPEELVMEGVIEKIGKNYSVQIPEMQGTELRFQKRFDSTIWGYRQTHTGSMEYAMFLSKEDADNATERDAVLKWFKESFFGEKMLNFSTSNLCKARMCLMEGNHLFEGSQDKPKAAEKTASKKKFPTPDVEIL